MANVFGSIRLMPERAEPTLDGWTPRGRRYTSESPNGWWAALERVSGAREAFRVK